MVAYLPNMHEGQFPGPGNRPNTRGCMQVISGAVTTAWQRATQARADLALVPGHSCSGEGTHTTCLFRQASQTLKQCLQHSGSSDISYQSRYPHPYAHWLIWSREFLAWCLQSWVFEYWSPAGGTFRVGRGCVALLEKEHHSVCVCVWGV